VPEVSGRNAEAPANTKASRSFSNTAGKVTRVNSSWVASRLGQRSGGGSGTGAVFMRRAIESISPSFHALRSSCHTPSPIRSATPTIVKRAGTIRPRRRRPGAFSGKVGTGFPLENATQ
jgi:hypothetical protein